MPESQLVAIMAAIIYANTGMDLRQAIHIAQEIIHEAAQ